jgi:NTE family protein
MDSQGKIVIPPPRTQGRSVKLSIGALTLIFAWVLSACAHVTNASFCKGAANEPGAKCAYDPDPQTSYRFTPKSDKHTLVIVTLSGGGTRAAALAFGTLQMLNELDPADANPKNPNETLLDQVDLISSVSGGSVTGGWYALKGKAGLATEGDNGQLWKFLNGNWTGRLAWKALNPWTLARYTFTDYMRSDVLADFFNDHLFRDATYRDVLEQYKRDIHQPYVILNATDIGHEGIFPFTQGHFDLLCSDLNQYRLTDAVAASGNFPLAFSPLGLQNFSPCNAQTGDWNTSGPPQWIDHYREFEGEHAVTPTSIQLSELRTARTAQDILTSHANGDIDKYVHLFDGGVADNLGVRSTLALEDDAARVPSLYLRLSGGSRPAGYQNIERVLYIVVNARTRDLEGLDAAKSPPGEIKTALRMADTLLDSSTLADQDYLIAELEATAEAARAAVKKTASSAAPVPVPPPVSDSGGDKACQSSKPFLSCKSEAQSKYPVPKGGLTFAVVSVDFEMIPYKTCRDKAWTLATNWGLKGDQVPGLAAMAKTILSNSVDLANFYRYSGGRAQPAFLKYKNFEIPCRMIGAEKQ